MLQSRIHLILVLLLTLLSDVSQGQRSSAEYSPKEANAPIFNYYRANFQPNQQMQANGMPFIVKDVSYNDAKQQQSYHEPDKVAANAPCCSAISDKKLNNAQISPGTSAQVNQGTSAQINQGTSAHVDQGTSAQTSQPPCPANGAATPVKQGAPTSASSSPSSAPAMGANGPSMETAAPSGAMTAANQNHPKLIELQKIVQQLYVAQAQVQLEANEIQRAQSIAGAAQQALEEASNNVRVIQAALNAAQETVAGCALRAQTAQLQLAAHDQLLFIARQRVDALSAQMVGLQAEEGIGEPKIVVDLPALLAKLKEPLPENQKPTPVPSILGGNSGTAASSHRSPISSQSLVASQNLQAQPQTAEAVDPNKFFEQLRAWNEQHSGRKPDGVNEKRQNLDDGMLFDEYGIDELEESPESSLTEETQTKGNVDTSGRPKVEELNDDDLKTLVDFIISTEDKQKAEALDNRLHVENMAKHAENEKYIDNFLNTIKNAAIQGTNSPSPRSNFVRSRRTDPKMMDMLLDLHESLFHTSWKQASHANLQEENKVDLTDVDQETDDVSPDLASKLEAYMY